MGKIEDKSDSTKANGGGMITKEDIDKKAKKVEEVFRSVGAPMSDDVNWRVAEAILKGTEEAKKEIIDEKTKLCDRNKES